LITKAKDRGNKTSKYKFWVHNLGDSSMDLFIKTYYKKMNLFIFVVDCTDSDGLAGLEKVIQNIKSELAINKKEFKAMLIVNQP